MTYTREKAERCGTLVRGPWWRTRSTGLVVTDVVAIKLRAFQARLRAFPRSRAPRWGLTEERACFVSSQARRVGRR